MTKLNYFVGVCVVLIISACGKSSPTTSSTGASASVDTAAETQSTSARTHQAASAKVTVQFIEDQRQQLEKTKQVAKELEAATATQKQALDAAGEGK